jgi:PKD repeat protein
MPIRNLLPRRRRAPAPSPGSATGGGVVKRWAELGQAVVEFAIVCPAMLLLMVMAIDFGRVLATYVQVTNAAREGAAYAAVNPTDIAGVMSHAQGEVNSQDQAGQGELEVTVTCLSPWGASIDCSNAGGGSNAGNRVSVTVSEPFSFITPLVGDVVGDPVMLSYSVTAPVLSLAPTGGSAPSQCPTVPVAAFSVTVQDRTVTLDGNASTPSTGVCAISGYNWDMGDGANPFPPVVGRNASYTYTRDGLFDVVLTVTNPAGEATAHLQVQIGSGVTPTPTPTPSPSPTPAVSPTAPPPVCNMAPTLTDSFTGNGNGSKKHQMTFYGAYTGQPAPASWTWDFGDGGATGSGVTASHDYEAPGNYRVTLTVRNGSCVATTSSLVSVP